MGCHITAPLVTVVASRLGGAAIQSVLKAKASGLIALLHPKNGS